MFCPQCGALSYPDADGKIKCPNHCGYSGEATHPRITVPSEKKEISRGGGRVSPEWDEPGPRITSTRKRECPKCGSTDLKTVGGDEECKKCGTPIP